MNTMTLPSDDVLRQQLAQYQQQPSNDLDEALRSQLRNFQAKRDLIPAAEQSKTADPLSFAAEAEFRSQDRSLNVNEKMAIIDAMRRNVR